jgi:acyl-CoA synthetase (AMP-forming)/AMP-acid ligase II
MVDASELKQDQIREARAEDESAKSLVSCGWVHRDQEIMIVHPEHRTRCQPKQVGEIWLSGPSVALGYWNRLEETERTFQAYLADTGEGPFLRTGDLGFLKDGELFVTGRLKDLVIIRGRNHYPQDIERTAERSHPALRPGHCAAFSVDVSGEEQLVVLAEVDERHRLRNGSALDVGAIIETIREAVAEDHELAVHAVLVLKAGSIPKTSSGKVQRYACRFSYLAEGSDAGFVESQIIGGTKRGLTP